MANVIKYCLTPFTTALTGNWSIALLLLLLITTNAFTQPPVTQEWVAKYPGPSNDLAGPFLQVDKFGNSYIAGTHRINDSLNILCVKYNTSGVQQWATTYIYPGSGYFAPKGLALDSSGNAYITSRYSYNVFTPINTLTVKFNSLNGSVIWARTYNAQYGESEPYDIEIDKLNNIYVVGWSDTAQLLIKYNFDGDSLWVRRWRPSGGSFPIARGWACTFDDSLNIITTGVMGRCSPGCDSLLLIKYKIDGTLTWVRTYRYYNTFPSYIIGKYIVTDQYGSVYIGGETMPGTYKVYLTLKYDRNGIFQWASVYDAPGNGDDNLRGIAIDRINNALYVTGGAVTNGVPMAITIKYNISTGDSFWVRRDTGIYKNGGANDIIVDSMGNSYITGSTNNIPPGSAVDVFTIKYSQTGNLIWLTTYNGTFNGWDGATGIKTDNINNIFIVGTSQSSSQITDYIVIKYNQLSGIKPIGIEIPRVFTLGQNYPNPFNISSKFIIAVSKLSRIEIRLFNILGREVGNLVNEKLKSGIYEVKFNANNYPSGIYFYQMLADGVIVDTKKLVILK